MPPDIRTALVTGGNRGIGLAAVTALARLGHRVILGSRALSDGETEAARLRAAGLDVRAVALDVAAPESIDAAVATLARDGVAIDALVNNAGVLHQVTLFELSDADIADSLAVHVTGPLRLARALAPGMIRRNYGRIVNVSSGWGAFAEGLGGPGLYGVTKAALNALTRRLAAELPPTVKANAMCPGWVRTRMGGEGTERTPEEGADTAVWLATLPADGPTGGFLRDRAAIGW